MTPEPDIIEAEAIEIPETDVPAGARGGDLAAVSKTSGGSSGAIRIYIVLPAILLVVTLFGGMRIGPADHEFLFLPPPLVCLVFAAMTVFLFIRSGLISLESWFAADNRLTQNAANALILLLLFTASVQVFNSLLPESGLPLWVVGFCLFWSLWTNLFAEFNAPRLLKSMTGVFFLAFVVKYLALSSLTAPEGGNWLQRLFQNPGREALTYLLDLPHYGSATGYIQFFTLACFLIGLYLTPRSTRNASGRG